MKQSLITVVGGSGFLGRYVVKHLADHGYRVQVLTRHPSSVESLTLNGAVGQISISYADLTRPETLDGKLKHSIAVINLVGILYEKGKQRFNRLHSQGAERLAKKAKAAGASHFIQVSSLGVDRSTQSHYARSKLAGEEAVLAVYPNATIIRPGVMFGHEDHFFNQFAQLGRLLHFYPCIGSGKNHMQPVYVDDVARLIGDAVVSPAKYAGHPYELGGPDIYSFEHLLRLVGQYTNQKLPIIKIPTPLASLLGIVYERLPKPPLTRDQVRLLQQDNIVADDAASFQSLGIKATPLESIVPNYLRHYRGSR